MARLGDLSRRPFPRLDAGAGGAAAAEASWPGARARHRSRRRAAHAAERQAGSASRRRSVSTSATAAPTRTPAMLRLGRQSIDIPPGDQRYVDHRLVRAAGRRRGAGGAAARALPRARDARRGDAARRIDATADSHRGLGFPLAARLPLRHAGRAAEGHDGCRCATPTTTRRRTRATRSCRRSACAGASDRRTRWATCGSRC